MAKLRTLQTPEDDFRAVCTLTNTPVTYETINGLMAALEAKNILMPSGMLKAAYIIGKKASLILNNGNTVNLVCTDKWTVTWIGKSQV